ncbi:hypothetical protein [Sphingomonas sp.]|uniref:hypothetical protein n=1 Tax=Sphingomonas sp. TaxID=28214 RepID=UPI0035C7EA60
MSLSRFALDGAQALIVLLAMAAVPLAPPAKGRMLVVPVGGGDEAAAVRAAREAGALILGSGPLPRSTIVEGARGPMLAAAWRAGMVALAAPQGGCGEVRS